MTHLDFFDLLSSLLETFHIQGQFLCLYYRCTEILNLPYAARRLFNEKGKEIFTLKELQRDELVKT